MKVLKLISAFDLFPNLPKKLSKDLPKFEPITMLESEFTPLLDFLKYALGVCGDHTLSYKRAQCMLKDTEEWITGGTAAATSSATKEWFSFLIYFSKEIRAKKIANAPYLDEQTISFVFESCWKSNFDAMVSAKITRK